MACPADDPVKNDCGMSFRQVNAFLAVATTGDFGSAANQLNLTRPALARAMRDLETQLGETLFLRSAQVVKLTVAGEVLLPFARKLAAAYVIALGGVPPSAKPSRVVLAASSMVLPAVLPKMLQHMPPGVDETMSFTVQDLASQQVLKVVRSGEADLGLCMTTEEDAHGLYALPLLDSPTGLLVGPGVELPEAIDTLDQLCELSFARLSPDMVLPTLLQRMQAALPFYFDSQIVSNSIPAVMSAVAQGPLVTLVSAVSASSPMVGGLKFLPLSHLLPSLKLCVVYRRGDAPAQHWIDAACASVRSVTWHAANTRL